MVLQIPDNFVEVKICSISFQRHASSLLSQRKNQRNFISRRINPRFAMTDNPQSRQQQLPVVELRPFTKKVWRREKSLPDFYDKKPTEDNSGAATTRGPPLEVSPAATRLVRELTETRKSMESRQNTMDSSIGKYRNHPKAEFSHESNKTWRKQDLIPSFITRFERTKTSVEFLSKENSSLQPSLPFNNNNNFMWDNSDSSKSGSHVTNFKIRGGKMSQQINRRQLLYLNPLESYRQPNSWGTHYNSTDNSRHGTGRYHLAPSRNSFPMTSGRARELVLAGSQFNHPLKPIQREDTESPHRFNNKLGAAKCSLQVLNKLGAPTKLEKTLEMEYEMNLERFRKDRLFLPHDLKTLSNTYVPCDSTPTIGETFLRNAREANKPKKRYHPGGEHILGLMRQESTNGWYTTDNLAVPNIQRSNANHVLGPTLIHHIDTVLHEESSEAEGKTCSEVTPQSKNIHQIERSDSMPAGNFENSVNNCNINTKDPSSMDYDLNATSKNSLNHSQNIVESSLLQENAIIDSKKDNNNNSMQPTNQSCPIDSARIETNIEYLENLQRKSKSSSGQRTAEETTIKSSEREAIEENQSALDSNQIVSSQTKAQSETNALDVNSTSAEDDTVDGNPLRQNDATISNIVTPGIVSETDPNMENSPETDITSSKQATDDIDDSGIVCEPSIENLPITSEDSEKTQGSFQDEASCVVRHLNEHDLKVDSKETSVAEINVDSKTSGIPSQRPVLLEGRNVSHKANSVARSTVAASENSKQSLHKENTSMSSEIKHNMESRAVSGEEEEINAIGNNSSAFQVQEMEISPNPLDVKDDQSGVPIPEDEGISLTTPIEAAVLDSSMTEANSDQEGVMSGCLDNGDSGVSTTFITADESRHKELGGLMVHD